VNTAKTTAASKPEHRGIGFYLSLFGSVLIAGTVLFGAVKGLQNWSEWHEPKPKPTGVVRLPGAYCEDVASRVRYYREHNFPDQANMAALDFDGCRAGDSPGLDPPGP
jgi:hypothetical protein